MVLEPLFAHSSGALLVPVSPVLASVASVDAIWSPDTEIMWIFIGTDLCINGAS